MGSAAASSFKLFELLLLLLLASPAAALRWNSRWSVAIAPPSCTKSPGALSATATAVDTLEGSTGIEAAIAHLNTPSAQRLLQRLASFDPELSREMQDANFWSGGTAVVTGARCTGIAEDGLQLSIDLRLRGKDSQRRVTARFPSPVTDEARLKLVLIDMAIQAECLGDTAVIASLAFGHDTSMPVDFKFNNVPHAPWVRSYLYR